MLSFSNLRRPFAGISRAIWAAVLLGALAAPAAAQVHPPPPPCCWPPPCRCSCSTPPANMVGWWTLDESGPAFYDRALGDTGTGFNVQAASGGVNGFARFDGFSSFISIPDALAINFGTGNLSIDFWIRTGVNQRTVQSILDKRAAGIVGYHVFLYKGNVGLQLADSGGYRNFGSSAFVADSHWHHFAVTVDRTLHAGVLFYLDGVLTSPTGDPTSHPGSLSNTVPLIMGNRSAGLSDAFFLGQLDEMELFNRVLGPAEVAAIADAGSTGKCKCAALKTAPRAWWRFDEPAGSTAIDSGGDAQGPFDGNVVGAVRNSHGQVAGDLVFNGTSDAVEVPNAGPLALTFVPGATGAISIDAWIKTTAASGPIVTDLQIDPLDRGGDGYAFSYFNGQLDFSVQAIDSSFALTFLHVACSACPAVNDGQWHLVATTLAWGPGGGGATATLFVDGAPAATSAPVALSGTAGGSFRIGAQVATSRLPNATFFGGEIDEVEIFDRALTQADFLNIFAAGPAGKCQPCDVPPRPVASCGTTGALPCPGGEFCDFFTNCGAMNGGGLCAIRPHVCSPVSAPVCGCDQTTYNNACEAAAQGSSVFHTGPCP